MTEIGWPDCFGYTDFCDDVRQEVLGKTTLVGTYTGEMTVVGAPPVAIARLALAIHYYELPGRGQEPMELRVYLPGDLDDAPTHRIGVPPRDHQTAPKVEGEDPRAGLHFLLMLSPLIVAASGNIRVRMAKGEDVIRLGTLRVNLLTPAEAARSGIDAPSPEMPDGAFLAL